MRLNADPLSSFLKMSNFALVLLALATVVMAQSAALTSPRSLRLRALRPIHPLTHPLTHSHKRMLHFLADRLTQPLNRDLQRPGHPSKFCRHPSRFGR